jgi:radical SAM protein with 4Fe4S-binding SPASM domain
LAGRINKITSTSVYKIYNGIIKYIIAIKKWKGKIYRIRLDSASEPTSDNTKLNYEECKLLPLTLKSKPVLIYAEISTRCNLRCRMCGRAHYNISEADQGFMDRNIFKKLSALFTPNAQLALFGRGETLLHPDFIYFLKIARNAGMRVGFNTNGLLLTEKMAKAMVEYGQTHITFSCSAGTPQTYREIHGVDAWKKLWGNVKMLNDAKMKYGPARENHSTQDTLPVIYVEFVAQRSNIEELPALVSMAYNYALKGLMVIDVVAHSDKMEEERMNIPKNQPIAEEYYKKASLVCEDLIRKNGRDFDLRLPNSYSPITKKFSSEFEKSMLKGVGESADDAGSQSSGNGFCVEPWQTFYVRFDGTIAPCVITGRSLGDLHTAAADEIWNGSVYSKFRARMKGTSKPYECLRCHLFPGPKRYDTKLGDITQYELL